MCSTPKSSIPDHVGVVTQLETEDHSNSTHEEMESQSHLGSNNREQENENSEPGLSQSNQRRSSPGIGSSIGSGSGTASADRARSSVEVGLKEAELLVTSAQAEISKDGSCKDVLTLEELSIGPRSSSSAVPWFRGILVDDDFAEVNPYRAKFLHQLEELVKLREAITADSSLEPGEREKRLAAVTLPGEQENLPGMKLEDLW